MIVMLKLISHLSHTTFGLGFVQGVKGSRGKLVPCHPKQIPCGWGGWGLLSKIKGPNNKKDFVTNLMTIPLRGW